MPSGGWLLRKSGSKLTVLSLEIRVKVSGTLKLSTVNRGITDISVVRVTRHWPENDLPVRIPS